MSPDLAVLLVVADEVAELLLAALQRGVQLLHLAHQVRLLTLQALSVGFHGWGTEEQVSACDFSCLAQPLFLSPF